MMITERIDCTIERRLLVNYRIDPEVAASQLPPGLRPQLVSGWAAGGVCFIRLAHTRLPHFPSGVGLRTENAAHRFAVEWGDPNSGRQGVYVPRRDTNSRFASWSGGRVFPGVYHQARFEVEERPGHFDISVASRDGYVRLRVSATPVSEMGGNLFASIAGAVEFFRNGSLGYSPSKDREYLDTVQLKSDRWTSTPIQIDYMASSYFDDLEVFPSGTCILDSALLMKDLPATWTTQARLRAAELANS